MPTFELPNIGTKPSTGVQYSRLPVNDYEPSPRNETQIQQDLINQQDQSLDDLSLAIGRLGLLGSTINQELETQKVLLESLDRDMDRTQSKFEYVNKKISEFLKLSDRGSCWLIFVLSVILLILVFFVFYT
eukprot:GILJ01007170.1.p1 GENE.GILJ01007170.1~~GILJ01007170.1.p1  ORF type:complete len:131 (-),score=18.85 GILJ01007170.1:195-587(-)